MKRDIQREQLPSGKLIVRQFKEDGTLVEEQHIYGLLDIGINYDFTSGGQVAETYFVKRRLVSRRSYEAARTSYPDMPSANTTTEDFGSSLLREVRQQQRQNKAAAEKRLAESAEARFPRPSATNWLRVISGEESHLVVFASRDWKALARERSLTIGQEWLNAFGFSRRTGSVAEGFAVGYEVKGSRNIMLATSRQLLAEVIQFAANPPEVSRWSGSVRPQPRPQKALPLAWPTVLPPLITFLSSLREPTVIVYNHHQ